MEKLKRLLQEQEKRLEGLRTTLESEVAELEVRRLQGQIRECRNNIARIVALLKDDEES